MLESTPIDIVITDIRMANTDGLSLCQKISRMERNIQTIIISGFAEFSYAQRAISYGAVGYCLKPLEYDEIKRVLLRAVHRLKRADPQPDYDDLLDALQNADEPELVSLSPRSACPPTPTMPPYPSEGSRFPPCRKSRGSHCALDISR